MRQVRASWRLPDISVCYKTIVSYIVIVSYKSQVLTLILIEIVKLLNVSFVITKYMLFVNIKNSEKSSVVNKVNKLTKYYNKNVLSHSKQLKTVSKITCVLSLKSKFLALVWAFLSSSQAISNIWYRAWSRNENEIFLCHVMEWCTSV